MSYLGRSAKLSRSTQEKTSFLATAGQTSKTGLSYVATFVEVTVNGILLTDVTDYTATNGNSITFPVALSLNDEVTIVALKTFALADHYDKVASDARYITPTGDGSGLTGIVALPTQTSHSGKFLTTNGSAASWALLDFEIDGGFAASVYTSTQLVTGGTA